MATNVVCIEKSFLWQWRRCPWLALRLDLSGTSLSTEPVAPNYQWFLVYGEPLGFVKEAYGKATIHTVLVSVLSPQSFHPFTEGRFVLSGLFGKALVDCCGGVAIDQECFSPEHAMPSAGVRHPHHAHA